MSQNTFLSRRLLVAFDMAIEVHGRAKRKGDGSPYIAHPFVVLMLLVLWKADEDTCIAGLLHDVLEDVDPRKKVQFCKEIRRRFGPRVLRNIEGVTEQEGSLTWEIRKRNYLARLARASIASLLVCCADKTHNTFCLLEGSAHEGPKFWKRFNAPKEDKLRFYTEVYQILVKRLPRRCTRELGGYLSVLRSVGEDLIS